VSSPREPGNACVLPLSRDAAESGAIDLNGTRSNRGVTVDDSASHADKNHLTDRRNSRAEIIAQLGCTAVPLPTPAAGGGG
jgi:hypothetical protein